MPSSAGTRSLQLDWQRKYRVSLMPAYLPDLPALQTWTDALWAELGGVDPQAVALERVLERYLGTSSPNSILRNPLPNPPPRRRRESDL